MPEVLDVARRTMGFVRMNLGFTVVHELTGLTLAAFGLLPSILTAAAQPDPDFGILGKLGAPATA